MSQLFSQRQTTATDVEIKQLLWTWTNIFDTPTFNLILLQGRAIKSKRRGYLIISCDTKADNLMLKYRLELLYLNFVQNNNLA